MPRLSLQVARHSEMLGLACHAFDTKWYTQSLLLVTSCIGVPCLVVQVARLSEIERLACHAFDLKWHAQSSIAFNPFSGLVYQRTMPCCSSGTPMHL
ncbi:hypothetical protein AHAS_Ahas11G0206900 [Arachis hypogaea]